MAQNGLLHRAETVIFSHYFDTVGPQLPKFVAKPLFPTHFNVIQPNVPNLPHLWTNNLENRLKMAKIMENRAKMA